MNNEDTDMRKILKSIMNIKNIKRAPNICAFIYLLLVFINQLKPSHDEIFMIAYGLALIGFVIATIYCAVFLEGTRKIR